MTSRDERTAIAIDVLKAVRHTGIRALTLYFERGYYVSMRYPDEGRHITTVVNNTETAEEIAYGIVGELQ